MSDTNKKKYFIYEENNWIKWGVVGLNENEDKTDISDKFSDLSEEELSEMGLKPQAKNIPLTDDQNNRIGFNFLSDPNDKGSPRVAVIFSCDFESFQNENPDLLKKLHETYGNIRWVNKVCPGNARPRYNLDDNNMYNKVDGMEDKDQDVRIHDIKKNKDPKEKDQSENIKRGGLNQIFKDFFGSSSGNSESGEEFKALMLERSLPPIITDNDKFTNLKSNNKLTNDYIDFKTHAYYLIEDPKDFFRFALKNSKGKGGEFSDEKVKLTYLARQYNTGGGKKWDDSKKGSADNEGETDVYNLRARGYEEADYNVLIKTEFELTGKRNAADEFEWIVKLIVKVGRKVPSDPTIPLDKIKVVPEFNIDFSQIVYLDGNKEFDAKNPIVTDVNIMEGLIDALRLFKEKLTEVDPKTMLNYSKVMRSNIER